jgi:hypothetical protein
MAARKKAAKKAAAVEQITTPTLQIGRMRLTLLGVSQLICHQWDEKAKRQMRDKQQGKATIGKQPKDPVADFNAARYRDSEGRDVVQSIGLKKALVAAARFSDDHKMTELRGVVFTEGMSVPIQKRKGKKLLTYGIDLEPIMREDMVRVGGGKGTADLRYRPGYDDWLLNVTVQYNANAISEEQVVNLFRLAGFGVGLCEWRPECSGDFGRFVVEHVEILQRPKTAAA